MVILKIAAECFFEVINYGVDVQTGRIDYDSIESLAKQEKNQTHYRWRISIFTHHRFLKEWEKLPGITVLFYLQTLLTLRA